MTKLVCDLCGHIWDETLDGVEFSKTVEISPLKPNKIEYANHVLRFDLCPRCNRALVATLKDPENIGRRLIQLWEEAL